MKEIHFMGENTNSEPLPYYDKIYDFVTRTFSETLPSCVSV